MNDDMDHEDRLRALFHDAVSDVEPRDRLADVRRRTRARRTSGGRHWAPLLVGAGAVAATVVAATFVFGGLGDDPEPDHDIPIAGTSSTDGPTTAAAGVYFVGETPTGPRLFREFQAVTRTADPEQKVLYALQRLTFDLGPRDPDYRTLWPSDSFSAVRLEDDRIVVELGTDGALTGDSGLGRLGVQQAVYTAEAALGERLPLAFEWNGELAREVLGLFVAATVDRDSSFALTAPVNISDPSEGLRVDVDTWSANGTMSTNVRRVAWTLSLDGDVVLRGRAEPAAIDGPDARATLGAPGWETGEIDLSGLAPGDYVFEVTGLDVGQTSDAAREFSDTRTITVR
ncbi:hypothetical protein [Nocardioides antri]|uniref:GerMN domain-containing protein n=1 Tax=Nocardioides antri TaxID=2607659 RepID=A0A5B1M0K6_9ACTN|nr:hypothetical protein [Nocardioides antri]KAA1426196.1 hypothetical protein F0U47_14910 [Nocardioides antri]